MQVQNNQNIRFKGCQISNTQKGLNHFKNRSKIVEKSDIFQTSEGKHLFVWDNIPLPESLRFKNIKKENLTKTEEEIKNFERIESKMKPHYSSLTSILKAIDKSGTSPKEKEIAKQFQIDRLAKEAIPIDD